MLIAAQLLSIIIFLTRQCFYDSYFIKRINLIQINEMSLPHIVSLRLQDQRLAMCLTDTSGTIDLHVNDYLVSSGFAKFAESAKDVPTQD